MQELIPGLLLLLCYVCVFFVFLLPPQCVRAASRGDSRRAELEGALGMWYLPGNNRQPHRCVPCQSFVESRNQEGTGRWKKKNHNPFQVQVFCFGFL